MDIPTGQQTVFAFDFDGVICDSAGENARSTWLALRARWPQRLPETPPPGLLERYITCRPAIETGHQNIPLMWLLIEGVSRERILGEFDELIATVMAREGLDDAELDRMFGAARDAWLAGDEAGWLAAQGFYAGIPAAVNRVAERAVIITTKGQRFAERLVALAGIAIPASRVYGRDRLGSGGKRAVLEALLAANPAAEVHFFEDRIRTLQRLTDLPRTHLYLVDWGYNLPGEREVAQASASLALIDAAGFEALLATHGA